MVSIYKQRWGSALALGAFVPTLLAEEIDLLREAREVLCGGVQDFVFATTVAVPFYHWSKTGAPIDDSKLFFADLVTDSIIHARPTPVADAFYSPDVDGTAYSLKAVRSWNFREAVAARSHMCWDFNASIIAAYFSDAFARKGAVGIRNCADLIPFCDQDSSVGASARGFCPVTCGCDLPNSTLVLSSVNFGCPSSCLSQPAYEDVLTKAKCIDQSNVELSASVAWQTRARLPVKVATEAGWSNIVLQRLVLINRSMIEYGCTAIHVVKHAGIGDQCDEGDDWMFPLKSLRLFCPVACRCTSYAVNCARHCPQTSLAWSNTTNHN